MNKTGREVAIVFILAEIMLIIRRAQSGESVDSSSVILISTTTSLPGDESSKGPILIQSVNPSAITPRRYSVSDGTSLHQTVEVAAAMPSETDDLESHIERLLTDSTAQTHYPHRSNRQQAYNKEVSASTGQQQNISRRSWLSRLAVRKHREQQQREEAINILVGELATLEIEPTFKSGTKTAPNRNDENRTSDTDAGDNDNAEKAAESDSGTERYDRQLASNLQVPSPSSSNKAVGGGISDHSKRQSNHRNVPCFFNAITCY